MNLYTIRRTRIITDRFKVSAWTLDEAYDTVAATCWTVSVNVEKLEEVTEQTDSSVEAIDHQEARVRR